MSAESEPHLLIVSPQHHAENILASRSPSHFLSLFSPGTEPPESVPLAAENCLRLSFHDIAEARVGLTAPDARAINALLEFGARWRGSHPMLICCWAGISRSSAAAFILACEKRPGSEQEIACDLRRRAPFVTPNRLMVRLADDILARGGRMVDAIDAIGRGSEAPHGEPFDFPVWRLGA